MLIFKDLSVEIPGTNAHFFDLDQFSDNSKDDALLYGWNNLFSNILFDKIKYYKRKIYFNVTMPTEFCGEFDLHLNDKFDEVWTICPYSVKWLNNIQQTEKYKCIWYPMNIKYIPTSQSKLYDVCYHGGIHGQKYIEMLNIISKFNYRYMSMTQGINVMTRQNLQFATDLNLTNQEKLSRVAQCKISICYNSFFARDTNDVNNIKKQPRWFDNRAFCDIDAGRLIPQLKSRFIEASLCKTVNLVERDLWNVVEQWYEPDKHFIYFEGNDDLQSKIEMVLNNWDNMQNMIEDAFNLSKNKYGCDSLIERINARN